MSLIIYKPEKGPEPLKEILAQLFTSRGWGRRAARQQLENAWAEAVGVQHQSHTRVTQIRRGILEVEVDSAILLQELASFQKRGLLEKMKKAVPNQGIKDLRFKSGTWKK